MPFKLSETCDTFPPDQLTKYTWKIITFIDVLQTYMINYLYLHSNKLKPYSTKTNRIADYFIYKSITILLDKLQ